MRCLFGAPQKYGCALCSRPSWVTLLVSGTTIVRNLLTKLSTPVDAINHALQLDDTRPCLVLIWVTMLEFSLYTHVLCRLCERQTKSGGLNGRPEKLQDVSGGDWQGWCVDVHV